MQIVDTQRLSCAKRATSTRRIDLKQARLLAREGLVPRAGDLLLARADRIGQHDTIELSSGRKAHLYPGDEILVCYGNRYAPDQFEAMVPVDLSACNLIAAGGLAGRAMSWHSAMKLPTEITPIGLVAGADGHPLNIRQFRLPQTASEITIPVIFSVGTSMNSGKTTTAARLIRGFTLAGLKVGAAKVTGTSAGKDTWLMRDSGAETVVDFNDAGFATTYLEALSDVEDGTFRLLRHLQHEGCEIAVVEIADGLLQQETRELLQLTSIKRIASAVFFSSIDSMGATAGVRWLRELGYHVPALTGVMTNSPLAAREASEATGLPVLSLKSLQMPDCVLRLLPCAKSALDARRSGETVHDAIPA